MGLMGATQAEEADWLLCKSQLTPQDCLLRRRYFFLTLQPLTALGSDSGDPAASAMWQQVVMLQEQEEEIYKLLPANKAGHLC